MVSEEWIEERVSGGVKNLFKVSRRIIDTRTKFQKVDIIEHPFFGKILFLDSVPNVSTADEFIYHELIVHPACTTHGKPNSVLVIGGGDGGTPREVLKYKSVKSLTLVDVDHELVEICKKHLPEVHQGVFDDPRLRVVAEDGRRFVKECKESYDIIIIDLPDPVGPSKMLFTQEFYQLVYNQLKEGGVIAVQAEEVWLPKVTMHLRIKKTLESVFPVVRPLFFTLRSFHCVLSFIVASKQKDALQLSEKRIKQTLKENNIVTRYYDEHTHFSSFYIPRFWKEACKKSVDMIKDSEPLEYE